MFSLLDKNVILYQGFIGPYKTFSQYKIDEIGSRPSQRIRAASENMITSHAGKFQND